MKRILLFVFSVLLSLFSIAQSCNSLRYQDTIFHNVTVTTSQFGTATPYGVLAQPQNLYLDFYEPTGDTLTKRPLIVFQFGGGFTIGWRSEPDIPGFCNYFAKCGKGDLNPHAKKSATPSRWCVYQFRHFRRNIYKLLILFYY